MACLVSVSLPVASSLLNVNLSFSTTPVWLPEQKEFAKGRTPRKIAHFRPRNYRTATVLSAFYGLTDAEKNPNRIPRRHRLTPQLKVVACCTNVGSCSSHDVFSGYWVGPDVDDGWGFVEAFVNRI